MAKNIVNAILVSLLIFLLGGYICFAGEVEWQDIGRGNLNLKTVLVEPENPNVIYIGSDKGIFKSEDGGGGWRSILSLRGTNRDVNLLSFALGNKNFLYAATGNGLYFSQNQGINWNRIFKGKNYLENECTTVAILSTVIYLGTKGGLFVSKDRGRSWYKEKGKLGTSNILAIAYNIDEPKYPERSNFLRGSSGSRSNASQNYNTRDIYVACADGIFRTRDEGQSWERIFVAHPVENGFETEEEAEDRDEQERSSGIRYVSCDPNNLNCLYVATSRGINRSCDRGENWESVSSYGLLNRDVKFLLFSNRGNLYAVTKSGVFEYAAGRWRELSFGLVVEEVRFLALDSQNNLYAASDKGLFKANTTYSNNDGGGNIMSLYYKDEPKINEVQQAAIKYAEVEPGKIIKWRKQAAKKALLPQVSIGVDRNVTDLWHWEGGSTTKIDDDILRKGKDSVEWDVSLSWDLGELIWNNDQTSIDVRSRLMVELRPLNVHVWSLL